MIHISDFTINHIKRGTFKKEIPELYALKSVVENNAWHQNDVVFEHTIAVANQLSTLLKQSPSIEKYLSQPIDMHTRKELLYVATIFHDIAKPNTLVTNGNQTICPEHEKVGATMMKDILNRFLLSQKEKNFVIKIIENHGILHTILSDKTSAYKKKIHNFYSEYKNIALELVLLSLADTSGSQLQNKIPEEYTYRKTIYNNLISEYTK